MAEPAADLQHGTVVEHGVDHLAHVVDAQPVLGHDVTQPALIRARPVAQPPLEVRQVLLGHLERRRSSSRDCDVDDTVRHLDRHGPDLVGPVYAEPAAFDHGRAAHADVGVLGGDHHVAATEDDGVAGEAPSGGDADHGHRARKLSPGVEGLDVEPAAGNDVDIARATAAALGEEHHRQAPVPRQLHHPVLLVVIEMPLRTGQYGVVVVHDHRLGGLVVEQGTVDGTDPGDHPVGGGVVDEVLDGAARALSGDDPGAVLDPGTFIDEMVEVLSGGAMAGLASPGHRVGPAVVQHDVVTFEDLGQIGADVVEIDGVLGVGRGDRHLAFLDEQQGVALIDGVARFNADDAHHAGHVAVDDVLHLHRFHHQHLLARGDLVADVHRHGDNRALQRRAHRHRTVRSGDGDSGGGGHRGGHSCGVRRLFAHGKHRQRIVADPDAGPARGGRGQDRREPLRCAGRCCAIAGVPAT